MPKQLYKITQFHGGLNSNSDARDIAESELSEATDVMVDELGKIRLMGGTTAHAATSNPTVVINPGYGLFYFSHDRLEGNDAGAADVAETGADYLVLADTDTDTQFFIYISSPGENAWGGSAVIDLYSGTGTTGVKPAFYAVDGALRISDGNFGANNSNKWYGYIKRSHFANQPSPDSYDGWYAKDQEISAPTRGLLGLSGSTTGYTGVTVVEGHTDTGSTTTALIDEGSFAGLGTRIDGKGYVALSLSNDDSAIITARFNDNTLTTETTTDWHSGTPQTYHVHPSPGTGFNLSWDEHTPSGPELDWGTAATYEVASTFIYDGNQESLPYLLDGLNITLAADKFPVLKLFATGPYDSRITGGRLYYRVEDTASDWKLLVDIDLNEGARTTIGDSFVEWATGSSTTKTSGNAPYYESSSLYADDPNIALTYEILTGVSQADTTLYAQYKTSVVANRMVYAGNVKIDNIIYGDMVIKSPVNKFDIFSKSRGIEASVRDGDSIVKLEAYADRLLIFKKNKMELLNISQEVEFLEDTFMHKGVSHPAATCKTDFGIAWVNKQGCYLYDGQKVNNLLEKQGRQIIKESDWATFTALEPMIGYIPKKRQLLIANDVTTTGTGATFLYDIVTQSWVKGAAATITSEDKTNFITDWNGDLVYAHTAGTVVKWDDAADSSAAVDIKTKDIDFGQPGQDKRIYKFYVTHRGSASNIQLSYGINGEQDSSDFTSVGSELPVTSAVTDWVTTAITPTAFSCKSVRLRLFSQSTTTPANFEINDITIVFRLKGLR